jgi:hypothetical protein
MWDKLNTLTPLSVTNGALGAPVGTLVHVGGGHGFNPVDLYPFGASLELYIIFGILFVCLLAIYVVAYVI